MATPRTEKKSTSRRSVAGKRTAAAEGTIAPPVTQLSEAARAREPALTYHDAVLTPGGNVGLIVGVNEHAQRASVRYRGGIEHGMPLASLARLHPAPAAAWWDGLTEGERAAYLALSGTDSATGAWAWSQIVADAHARVLQHIGRQVTGTRPVPTGRRSLRFARPSNTFIELIVTGAGGKLLEIRTGIGPTLRNGPDEILNSFMVEIDSCWLSAAMHADDPSRCYLYTPATGCIRLYNTEADDLLDRCAGRALIDYRKGFGTRPQVIQ